jgi:hypothetical protein
MLLKLPKSKIHRATVTRADLNYEGGFEALMRANPKTSGAGISLFATSPLLTPTPSNNRLRHTSAPPPRMLSAAPAAE